MKVAVRLARGGARPRAARTIGPGFGVARLGKKNGLLPEARETFNETFYSLDGVCSPIPWLIR